MTQTTTQNETLIGQLSSGDRLPSSIAATCEGALGTKAEYIIATHCHDGHKDGLHLMYHPDGEPQVALVDIAAGVVTVRSVGTPSMIELVETDSDEIRNNPGQADSWLDYLWDSGPDEYRVMEDHGDGEITMRMRSIAEGESAIVRAILD